jgi:hypothetical protein
MQCCGTQRSRQRTLALLLACWLWWPGMCSCTRCPIVSCWRGAPPTIPPPIPPCGSVGKFSSAAILWFGFGRELRPEALLDTHD